MQALRWCRRPAGHFISKNFHINTAQESGAPPVGSQVLVAEAARNLVVLLHARAAQQLLKLHHAHSVKPHTSQCRACMTASLDALQLAATGTVMMTISGLQANAQNVVPGGAARPLMQGSHKVIEGAGLQHTDLA